MRIVACNVLAEGLLKFNQPIRDGIHAKQICERNKYNASHYMPLQAVTGSLQGRYMVRLNSETNGATFDDAFQSIRSRMIQITCAFTNTQTKRCIFENENTITGHYRPITGSLLGRFIDQPSQPMLASIYVKQKKRMEYQHVNTSTYTELGLQNLWRSIDAVL